MKLEFENNFESVLNDIVERASSVFGEKPLDEILTDEFIQKNSSFGSLVSLSQTADSIFLHKNLLNQFQKISSILMSQPAPVSNPGKIC